jgi:alkylation response protein AidB-like acyl-CoA dehydrogenase
VSESGTAAALAGGIGALLASHAAPTGRSSDCTALLKEAARAGWLDVVPLGLSGADALTIEDAFIVCETLGRRIAPFSLLVAAAFVKPLLSELGPVPFARRIEAWLDDGVVIAVPTPRLLDDPDTPLGARFGLGTTMQAEDDGTGIRLTGFIERVTDGGGQGMLLTAGDQLLTVTLDSPGVTIASVPAVVAGHEVGRVEFDGVFVESGFIHRGPIASAIHRAAMVWSLGLDAYAVGICRELVASTVEFALSRRQFGQPIGAFQAVQHLAADMQIAAETSFSILLAAAESWLATPDQALEHVVASRLHSAAAAVKVSEMAIQLHGGIGFTWEMEIHSWYRAAQFAQRYLTEEVDLRNFLACRLGADMLPAGAARPGLSQKGAPQ